MRMFSAASTGSAASGFMEMMGTMISGAESPSSPSPSTKSGGQVWTIIILILLQNVSSQKTSEQHQQHVVLVHL